jgi:type IV pilus assembly protein PilX
MNKILLNKTSGPGCRHGSPPMRQRGAVLVVSLLILLIMTIIGVTAMQTTSLEERMAGNLLDQRLAFQTTEAALRTAEEAVEALVAYPSTTGYYGETADDPYDSGTAWSSISKLDIDDAGSDVYAEYYVKNLGTFMPDPGPEVTDYPGPIAGSTVTVLSITARGTGRHDETGGSTAPSQVFLRSYYGKRF